LIDRSHITIGPGAEKKTRSMCCRLHPPPVPAAQEAWTTMAAWYVYVFFTGEALLFWRWKFAAKTHPCVDSVVLYHLPRRHPVIWYKLWTRSYIGISSTPQRY
jgi:hypothetical protein